MDGLTKASRMRRFFCYCAGRIIGTVEAIDGDTAWALARLAQPNAECLREMVLI
jgi:hypothetical protein